MWWGQHLGPSHAPLPSTGRSQGLPQHRNLLGNVQGFFQLVKHILQEALNHIHLK